MNYSTSSFFLAAKRAALRMYVAVGIGIASASPSALAARATSRFSSFEKVINSLSPLTLPPMSAERRAGVVLFGLAMEVGKHLPPGVGQRDFAVLYAQPAAPDAGVGAAIEVAHFEGRGRAACAVVVCEDFPPPIGGIDNLDGKQDAKLSFRRLHLLPLSLTDICTIAQAYQHVKSTSDAQPEGSKKP